MNELTNHSDAELLTQRIENLVELILPNNNIQILRQVSDLTSK